MGVWQGLADLDPDVDALYRLIMNDETVFDRKPAVHLKKGKFCPFNSQNTFWRKELFAAMYLPAFVSFRFTDILRGYIAQPLMWNENMHLGFMNATVYQERNVHDLMRDFNDEVEVYQNSKPISALLETIKYTKSLTRNVQKVYQTLHKHNYVTTAEYKAVEAWLEDVKRVS